jgi:hypothetical protein
LVKIQRQEHTSAASSFFTSTAIYGDSTQAMKSVSAHTEFRKGV